MKKITLFIICMFLQHQTIKAQTLYSQVYQVFQDNCVNCHNNTTALGALNLEGIGNNLEEKESDVYNYIVGISSDNPHALASGYQTIYPGRPDRSFLFRKVNQGLDSDISLHSAAGEPMPAILELSDKEKEMIRQWILIGAPLLDSDADLPIGYVEAIPNMLEKYYNENGIASFPSGPPPPPDPSEGFQIKMGPFFLNPAGQDFSEIELFQKVETELQMNIEINACEAFYPNYSHHFNIFDINDTLDALDLKDGFRSSTLTADKYRVLFSSQYSGYYPLPEKTGIKLSSNSTIDLNSHFANYSSSSMYKAEVYINIYTQPSGTAIQELHYGFGANFDIPIPNNGNAITHTQEIFGFGEVYVWALTGHTHKLGVDYKIYLRNPDGTKGQMIYDGSCPEGIPDCSSSYFDFSHLPIRFFEPFLKIDLAEGIIHEAKWINNGPEPVNWGLTTEDEMMVFASYFAWDTVGLNFNTTSISNPEINYPTKVFPNPMQEQTTIEIPDSFSDVTFVLFNAIGHEVVRIENIYSNAFTFFKGNLGNGIYFFRLEDENGKISAGKILIE